MPAESQTGVYVELDRSKYERLKSVLRDEGRSVSWVFRKAVDAYLDRTDVSRHGSKEPRARRQAD